jgi:chromosome segregation ATPase
LRAELATLRQSLAERERVVADLAAAREAAHQRELELDAAAKAARSGHEEILVQLAEQHREEAHKSAEQHKAEMQRILEAHREELQKAASQRELELKNAAERHVRELKGFEDAAKKSADALRAEHQQAIAELQREAQEKLAKSEAAATAIEAQLGQDLAAARNALDDRKRELDVQHGSWTAALAQRDEALTKLGAQHNELLQRARWLDNELGVARERITALEGQLDKARRRWGEDREALKQSKNALAMVVRQLDEASVVNLDDDDKR